MSKSRGEGPIAHLLAQKRIKADNGEKLAKYTDEVINCFPEPSAKDALEPFRALKADHGYCLSGEHWQPLLTACKNHLQGMALFNLARYLGEMEIQNQLNTIRSKISYTSKDVLKDLDEQLKHLLDELNQANGNQSDNIKEQLEAVRSDVQALQSKESDEVFESLREKINKLDKLELQKEFACLLKTYVALIQDEKNYSTSDMTRWKLCSTERAHPNDLFKLKEVFKFLYRKANKNSDRFGEPVAQLTGKGLALLTSIYAKLKPNQMMPVVATHADEVVHAASLISNAQVGARLGIIYQYSWYVHHFTALMFEKAEDGGVDVLCVDSVGQNYVSNVKKDIVASLNPIKVRFLFANYACRQKDDFQCLIFAFKDIRNLLALNSIDELNLNNDRFDLPPRFFKLVQSKSDRETLLRNHRFDIVSNKSMKTLEQRYNEYPAAHEYVRHFSEKYLKVVDEAWVGMTSEEIKQAVNKFSAGKLTAERLKAMQSSRLTKAQQEAKAKAEREAKERAEQEAKAKAEREAKEKAEREAKEKAEREAKEKAEREAKAKAEREAKEKAEREAKEKAEREAKEKAEREAKERAEQEAKAKAEREAKEKAEREAKEKAEREAKERAEQEAKAKAEREAKERAEREAKEKAEREAKEKAEREAKEKAEREAKERAEQEAKERAEQEAKAKAEREAKEKAEREAKEKAEREAKEKAEREAKAKAEREAKEKAEREAKERAEQEAKERAEQEAKEKAEREAKAKAEREAKEKAEREAKEKAEREAKEQAEQEAKAKAEREAKEKAEQEAKEKAEREAKERAEQEAKAKAEREAKAKAEQEAKAKAEREAKEKAEQEAKEKAEQEAREQAEQEAEAAAREAELAKAARAKQYHWGRYAIKGIIATAITLVAAKLIIGAAFGALAAATVGSVVAGVVVGREVYKQRTYNRLLEKDVCSIPTESESKGYDEGVASNSVLNYFKHATSKHAWLHPDRYLQGLRQAELNQEGDKNSSKYKN